MSFTGIHGAGIAAELLASMTPAEMSFAGTVEDNPIIPPDVILGANLLLWLKSDAGVTQSGTVSAWADQSGNGHDFAQGTAGSRPTYFANGGPNDAPYIQFDGTDDLMVNTTLDLAAPGTTPTLLILVMRQDSWTGGEAFCGSDAAFGCEIRQAGASPNVSAYNGVDNQNSELLVSSWGRVQGFYNNAVSDYTLVTTKATGANAGNSNPGLGRRIGRGNPSGAAAFSVVEHIIANRDLTAGEQAQMDAYLVSRYGAIII